MIPHIPPLTRPLLRYHGSKFRLAPWIIGHFPEHSVYTEVFAGGAGVFFRKPPSEVEILNDLNGDVVNLFRCLRDPYTAKRLVEAIYLTPYAKTELDLSRVRDEEVDAVEEARRFVAGSWFSVGGDGATRGGPAGFRRYSRVDKIHVVPVHSWKNYPEVLQAAVERLRGVIIEQESARIVLARHDCPRALHYVDPPYLPDVRGEAGRRSYSHEMTEDDHVELLQALYWLKGKVAISGYRHPIYDEILEGWVRVERETQTVGAAKRTEVLWMNY